MVLHRAATGGYKYFYSASVAPRLYRGVSYTRTRNAKNNDYMRDKENVLLIKTIETCAAGVLTWPLSIS